MPLPDVVIPAVGQIVPAQNNLDLPGSIFQVGKAQFAHDADTLEPPGHADHGARIIIAVSLCRFAKGFFIEGPGLGNGVGAPDARRVWLDTAGAQRFQVLQPGLFLIGQVFRGKWVEWRIIHAAISFPKWLSLCLIAWMRLVEWETMQPKT